MPSRSPHWPKRDDELRAHWAAGTTTPQIAQHMGITKNALIGRAHRLNLPARPSPILRDTERAPRKSYAERKAATERNKAQQRQGGTGLLVGPTLAPLTLPGLRLMAAVVKAGPVSACCWPLGDPRTPEFRFCGDPATNRSYCAAHYALAYVPTRRQEVADAA